MAVLRGILLFAFFGGLVWLAVTQGMKDDGGGGAALAAEQRAPDPSPVEHLQLEAQSDLPQGGSAPVPPGDSGYGDPGSARAEPLALEDDPYVIDAPEELPPATTPATHPTSEGPEVSILGFDDSDDAGPGSAAALGTESGQAAVDREVPEWLADEPEGLAADSAGEAEWAPIELGRPLEPAADRRDPGDQVLLAPARSASADLADLLLQAVVSGDPQRLNEHLNRGEIGAPERNLISAFWMAVTGELQQGREWMQRLEPGEGVTETQLGLLAEALDGARARPMEASFGRRDPVAMAMTMVLLNRDAQHWVREGHFREASEALSELVLLEVDAPWASDQERLVAWGELLNDCQDRHRLNPRGEWPGIEYEVQSGDNLIAIRKKVLEDRRELLLCTGLIEQTNDLSGFLQPGMRLRIPTARPNVLVDLGSRVVLYRHGGEVVRVWTVGIGREGSETPTGDFLAGEKQADPAWMPVGGRQLPFGHPDNPLGTRWIEWYRGGAGTSYGFHGTSDPTGVGRQVSQGCIRMHNEHVEELYDLLPLGAEIRVQS